MTDGSPVVVDRSVDLGVRRYEDSRWSGAGVTPFGDVGLHSPTVAVDGIDDQVREVADYMVSVMQARHGIGLAANQVGLPWRMFVHNLPKVAPQVIINPLIVDLDESWVYSEACLSLTVEESRSEVIRPKRIVVEAVDIDGAEVRIAADEVLARVFQHEIDHLDGIVYVQRLIGDVQRRVYTLMEDAGIDTARLPPTPYE